MKKQLRYTAIVAGTTDTPYRQQFVRKLKPGEKVILKVESSIVYVHNKKDDRLGYIKRQVLHAQYSSMGNRQIYQATVLKTIKLKDSENYTFIIALNANDKPIADSTVYTGTPVRDDYLEEINMWELMCEEEGLWDDWECDSELEDNIDWNSLDYDED